MDVYHFNVQDKSDFVMSFHKPCSYVKMPIERVNQFPQMRYITSYLQEGAPNELYKYSRIYQKQEVRPQSALVLDISHIFRMSYNSVVTMGLP